MWGLLLVAALAGTGRAVAQTGNTALDTPQAQTAKPAPGSTAGEMPLDTPSAQGSGDHSALASPVPSQAKFGTIAVGTEIRMTVTGSVNSGIQINGDKVRGTLQAPVKTTAGNTIAAGAAVEGTVVSSAKAGSVASGGILSLQLTRVGAVAIITDVLDFSGQEGHKDLADAAPAKGTEAMVAAGTTLDFHVLETGKATGLVPGVPPATNAGAPAGGQGGAVPPAGQGIPQTPIHGATQGVTPR